MSYDMMIDPILPYSMWILAYYGRKNFYYGRCEKWRNIGIPAPGEILWNAGKGRLLSTGLRVS
jgi:hypothetical protein